MTRRPFGTRAAARRALVWAAALAAAAQAPAQTATPTPGPAERAGQPIDKAWSAELHDLLRLS